MDRKLRESIKVLNLIITGIPSKPSIIKVTNIFISIVLNLIITGIPSIHIKERHAKMDEELF